MSSNFFADNRTRFIDALGDKVAVIAAYEKMQFANDAAAPFRQESNFWWLTGIELPGWKVVVDGETRSSYLVRPELHRVEKIFESWLGDDEATQISGIDEVVSLAECKARLAALAEQKRSALSVLSPRYNDIFCHPNPSFRKTTALLKKAGLEVSDAAPVLAKLRAIKTPAEIERLRAAIAVTNDAFIEVKTKFPSLKNERDIEALFSYNFTMNNATHAYDPIVAFGKNACTMHYVQNNSPLSAGLVLLDVGALVGGYSADITRTYATGEVSSFARDVHQTVVAAQKDIIALLRPGLAVKEYSRAVDERMQRALIDLGLIKNVDDPRYRDYFPHAISHGLGVDVHDRLGGATEFQAGMVLTVEPGIYVPEQSVGVRIEDDILITSDGHENLSAALSTDM